MLYTINLTGARNIAPAYGGSCNALGAEGHLLVEVRKAARKRRVEVPSALDFRCVRPASFLFLLRCHFCISQLQKLRNPLAVFLSLGCL